MFLVATIGSVHFFTCCLSTMAPSRTNTSRARRVLAPSFWQKEMQRTAAIAVLETLYAGPPMQVQKLQDEMFKLFHGDSMVPESIGYTDHLLKGIGRFERLWDQEPLINNAASNAEMQLPFNLVMKDEFSRDGSKRLFAGSFTPLSVKSTGSPVARP